ncbi:AbrB/MazE/SpoVT family DNA-binding domain-containing protein [Oxyplasma meridianum]|uniref:AbrB/MazE/SpoVT family DNA-binding domain-containing protein n=1 Tax=Oxyplasma meridianum TaxID=3073602 RepID=A0AAX4NDQ9_9ARCH
MVTVTRKVQQTGGSTFIVSLPTKWAKENGLKRGSELVLEEEDGNLIIRGKSFEHREIVKTINIEDEVKDGNLLQRTMTSFYISNFKTLIIRTKGHMKPDLREEIRRFSKVVMGVEIFEESANTIVLQNVLDSSTFPLNNSVRRMSLNVETMLADVIEGIRKKDQELLESIEKRDDDVDRYQWYIYREVIKEGGSDTNRTFSLILSRILERIADHAVNLSKIWKVAAANVEDGIEGITRFLGTVQAMYMDAITAFYSRTYANLNSIINRKDEVLKLRSDLLMDRSIKDIYTKAATLEEISRIGLYATDIAELAMDLILSEQDSIKI